MSSYKALSKQSWTAHPYSIVPIRRDDRYNIMQWRNEQIYHLRQTEPLTKEKQDWYFENVVAKLFEQEKPNQILFSFLKNGECIGYGGLVHINWIDKHAEISFIMNTALEEKFFETNWSTFLLLIEKVAFQDLNLHKIFTYAFNLRPHLYTALENVGFKNEAVLTDHCLFDGKFDDVVIHSKIKGRVSFRQAKIEDKECTYQWAKNSTVRRFAQTQNEINYADHEQWFSEKITNPNCLYFIAIHEKEDIGSFRLDIDQKGIATISYLLDPTFHGKGLGRSLLKSGIEQAKTENRIRNLIGYVKEQNEPSMHLFRTLGFQEEAQENGLFKFQLKVK